MRYQAVVTVEDEDDRVFPFETDNAICDVTVEDARIPGPSQRDRFVALLTEFGITPEITVDEHHGGEWADTRNPDTGHKTYTERIGGQHAEDIRLEAGDDGVGGYNGFMCIFTFDEAGKFLEVGIWE